MLSSRFVSLAVAFALAVPIASQEKYWIANRGSSDLMAVDPCGNVVQTVPMGTSLRSAHVAPDGKIWVVRFIQGTIDILNPDGTPFLSPGASLGNPYDIAFDAAGHAWVSGGSGVEEFDANGIPQATYPLTNGAPLGITVDAQGNKWIAHRVGPPGVVSRIDVAGNVTSYSLTPNSLILPTRILADFRGANPSHLWIVGDNRGAGELVEIDSNGVHVSLNVIGAAAALGSLVASVDPATGGVKDIFVGDFRNGDVHVVDAATNTTMATYNHPPDAIGLNIGGFQKLWVTSRGSTIVQRVDPATGVREVAATVGSGVQSSLSTRWHHANVVDPLGDLDGDRVPNTFEVQQGSSPFDPCSSPVASLSVDGTTSLGSSPQLRVVAGGTDTTILAFALGTISPGIPLPGFACRFQLDPTSTFGETATVTGSTALRFRIPTDPGLAGVVLFVEGLNVSRSTFTNVTCFKLY